MERTLLERLREQITRAGVAGGVDADEHARAVAQEVARARRAAEQRREVHEMSEGLVRKL